jgi:two-component system chemotaxis response regulator CheB
MQPPQAAPGHDIIVIGGSTGGIEALRQIVASFPDDLAAAVLVVIHTAAGYTSHLPDLLAAKSKLKATLALHGEPLTMGRIHVAPPDNHLLLRPGYLAVQRGPKENGSRPAVDPLFRSASIAYGPRVVAVVLSGHLDCGTAGLLSVKARGGIAIVQDPDEAIASDMPCSALKHASVDHVLRAADIGPMLVRLTREPVIAEPAPPSTALFEMEGDEPGMRSDVVCPICQGALTEGQLSGVTTFRCHVGHAFSQAALLAEQAESLERALWAAVRALEESARVANRMSKVHSPIRERLEEKAETQMAQADTVRRMLLGQQTLNVNDATGERVEKSEEASGGKRRRNGSGRATGTRARDR